ncbi:hypothetical protein BC01_108 [Bacillus phage BC01]|nr:putative HNH endonuclease [Bacillus phage PBC6]AXU41205.1 hypothetical protein BC01_108 [Bacillus phage BC01]
MKTCYTVDTTSRKWVSTMEQWQSLDGIVENGENYAVSNLGNVKHSRKGNILKFYTMPAPIGYYQVSLSCNGKTKKYLVHRLVALAFIPNPDNKREVNHKDGNKLNNYIDNLEWNTSKENQQHAMKLGLQPVYYGSEAANAKLTEEKVRTIRELYAKGNCTHQQIADIFGVGKRNITAIINRKTWKHVV